jgi:hypothetical protein
MLPQVQNFKAPEGAAAHLADDTQHLQRHLTVTCGDMTDTHDYKERKTRFNFRAKQAINNGLGIPCTLRKSTASKETFGAG